ncbi:unnamed protein product [Caenorhabditis brenneri]
MNDKVTLAVGLGRYQTTKTTLTRIPSWFHDAVTSNHPLDETGAIFIDRSNEQFELILNFIRDGDVALPDEPHEVQEILKEAIHYKLDDLVDLCKSAMKIRIIESDEQMLQVIARARRPILIIHHGKLDDLGLIFNSHGTFSNFESDFKRWFDIYFKTNTTPDIDATSWSFSIHDPETDKYEVDTYGSPYFYVNMMEAIAKFMKKHNLND